MFRETEWDAVMIGRGAATNPWIFRHRTEYFARGHSASLRRKTATGCCASSTAPCPRPTTPRHGGKTQQFASRFTHGVQRGGPLGQAVHSPSSTTEVIEPVEAVFSSSVVVALSAAVGTGSLTGQPWAAAD